MFKLDVNKAEEPEIKLWTSVESLKMQVNSRGRSTSASLTSLKPLTTNWKILRDGNTRPPPLSASYETCVQVKKQQLEPDMEQWTDSKLGKE